MNMSRRRRRNTNDTNNHNNNKRKKLIKIEAMKATRGCHHFGRTGRQLKMRPARSQANYQQQHHHMRSHHWRHKQLLVFVAFTSLALYSLCSCMSGEFVGWTKRTIHLVAAVVVALVAFLKRPTEKTLQRLTVGSNGLLQLLHSEQSPRPSIASSVHRATAQIPPARIHSTISTPPA